MQVYIQGTKKAINEQIKNGSDPVFAEYTPWNINAHSFKALPQGTVVKFWSKRDYAGTPIARAYGQVKGGKIV